MVTDRFDPGSGRSLGRGNSNSLLPGIPKTEELSGLQSQGCKEVRQ